MKLTHGQTLNLGYYLVHGHFPKFLYDDTDIFLTLEIVMYMLWAVKNNNPLSKFPKERILAAVRSLARCGVDKVEPGTLAWLMDLNEI